MELLTLGELVEREGDSARRQLLRQEITRAKTISGRVSFDNVRIKSVSEMGEAAGRCHMCSGDIEVREDIVSIEEAIRTKLAHVLVHEHMHSEGIAEDGFAEAITSSLMGEPSVPAYDRISGHVGHIFEVAGVAAEEAVDMLTQEGGEVILWTTFVAKRVAANMEFDTAVAEADEYFGQLAA